MKTQVQNEHKKMKRIPQYNCKLKKENHNLCMISIMLCLATRLAYKTYLFFVDRLLLLYSGGGGGGYGYRAHSRGHPKSRLVHHLVEDLLRLRVHLFPWWW